MSVLSSVIPPRGAGALPVIIQGGMGVGVSGWRLANAAANAGAMGVVSGTALDTVMVRRLQDGDIGGDVRRALAAFPFPGIAEAILKRYFLPEGRPAGKPYKLLPMYKQSVTVLRQQLTIAANFVEVFLAKEGHSSPIGVNLLTKVQLPNLASLYGAMLAGVDYVLMGAGIPREIPGALDALAQQQKAAMRLEVDGLPADRVEHTEFDPLAHTPALPTPLKRPAFLPIVSANSLAATLARKSNGAVNGFIVEGPTAGGHNAPPRGALQTDASGEPLYGERDMVNLQKLAELGLPFWIAGGVGTPDGLRRALETGATGIQVGTLFAYCDESGLSAELRTSILAGVRSGAARVRTDVRASPTGYPFKIVELPELNSQPERERVCDLGYLRVAYMTESGRIGYRCPAEPVAAYLGKGGSEEDTKGRRCLCNGLLANIGHAQLRPDGRSESALVTSGDQLPLLREFIGARTSYTAREAVEWLLGAPVVPTCERPQLVHAGNEECTAAQ